MSLMKRATLYDDQGVQATLYKTRWRSKDVVLKKSRHIDFVLELEWTILQQLAGFQCIHYCNGYRLKQGFLMMDEIKYKGENVSLHHLVHNRDTHWDTMINCIRQTLAAVMLYKSIGITHYDLHADNVMVTTTPYDVHVYQFDDEFILPIRTFGIAPVIIDFGLAYCPGAHLNATLALVQNGFTTFMEDDLVDARLLLVSLYDTFLRHKETNQVKQLRQVIKDAFKGLKLTPQGWFTKDPYPNVMDAILGLFPTHHVYKSTLCQDEDVHPWLIAMIHHRVALPLVKLDKLPSTSFATALVQFDLEWYNKVEPLLGQDLDRQQHYLKEIVFTNQGCDALLQQWIDILRRWIQHVCWQCQQTCLVRRQRLYSQCNPSVRHIVNTIPHNPFELKASDRCCLFTPTGSYTEGGKLDKIISHLKNGSQFSD